MYPYIHIILPSYGVLAFVGAFAALFLVYFRIERFGVQFSDLLKLFPCCLLGGFVGSKLLFILTRLPQLFQDFSWQNTGLLVLQSGFVFYGGLFGVLLALALYARFTRCCPVHRLYQLAAPAIPLFHCFGRIGCLLSGCCYGVTLSQPVVLGGISFERFPTQIMEAFFELLLFAALLVLERRGRDYDLLRVYLLAYAVFRFLLEFFRGDAARGFFLGLSTAQWISLLIVLCYAVRAARMRRPGRVRGAERH